jgi:hypothetical protein
MRLVYVAFSVFLLISGCKSAQKAGTDKRRDTRLNRSEETHLEYLSQKESTYPHSISFKDNAKYVNADKSTSMKANVRMVTDSAIWMSISGYGYEAVRILATPDSLKFIDKLEKKYYEGDYSFFESKLGVRLQFSDLQSVLLGHSLGLRDDVYFSRGTNRHKIVVNSMKPLKYVLKDEAGTKHDTVIDVLFTNWIDPQSYDVEHIEVLNMLDQSKVEIFYTGFEKFDSISVLSGLKMKIGADSQGEVNADFSKIEINSKVDFPFKISEKYEPIN